MSKWLEKFSLRTVLIIPFVLQTVAAVGLVGYFSYKNGQQAVENLAKQVMEQVSIRIADRLDRYLEKPQKIVSVNNIAVKEGTLNVRDLEQIRQHFWQQMMR